MAEEKHVVKKISQDKWFAMLERIQNNGHPIKADEWYPSMEDAMDIAKEPIKNYEFIMCILESNDEIELTPEQLKVEKYLQNVFDKTTEFTD